MDFISACEDAELRELRSTGDLNMGRPRKEDCGALDSIWVGVHACDIFWCGVWGSLHGYCTSLNPQYGLDSSPACVLLVSECLDRL